MIIYFIIFYIACHVDSSQFSYTESATVYKLPFLCLILKTRHFLYDRIKKANVTECIFYLILMNIDKLSLLSRVSIILSPQCQRAFSPHAFLTFHTANLFNVFHVCPPNGMSLF